MTHFFLKPNQSGVPVPFTGVGDLPGTNNHGTEIAPVIFSAGAVGDWIWNNPDPEMTFHFASGNYTVGPERINGQYCQGADNIWLRTNPANAVLQPPYNVPVSGRIPRLFFIGDSNNPPVLKNFSHNYTKAQTDSWGGVVVRPMFYSDNYVDHIQVEYITFDDNFLGMGYPTIEGSSVPRGFKLFSLALRAKTGVVRGCISQNSGASGGVDYLQNEAFPINIYAMEPPKDGWLIENNTIRNFRARNGGYATLISPCMFTATSTTELYPPTGDINEWFACTVRGNTVDGTGTPVVNGMGSSGFNELASHRILFTNNVAINCALGSNNDTGGVIRQHYICNSFIDCTAMIQLGSPTSNPCFMRNFRIDNNYIRIKGLPGAEVAPGWPVKRCCLHIRNNARGILLRDNTIDHGAAAQFGGSYFRVVNLSGQDGYYPAYYGSYGPKNADIDPWIAEDRGDGTLFKGTPLSSKSTEDERYFGKIAVADDDRWTVV